MTHGNRDRTGWTAALLACLAAGSLAGCAQQGPLMSRRTTLGSLKTSVGHLELENSRLKTEVAGLKQENRRLGDRLVQEEEQNGELAARLDDARYLLNERGLGGDETDRPGADPLDTIPTRPVGRARRKPPVARIPARTEPAPEDDYWNGPSFNSGRREASPRDNTQSRRDELDSAWLPVARGSTAPRGARIVR